MLKYVSKLSLPTLAGELSRRLSESVVGYTGPQQWFAAGNWILRSHFQEHAFPVHIEYLISANWMEVPPIVTTSAPFMRRDIDWHVYPNGRLCYVFDEEWKFEIQSQLEANGWNLRQVVDFAASWCLSATDSLISRHLAAHRFGLEKWPTDWSAWPHGPLALAAFVRERRQKKRAA